MFKITQIFFSFIAFLIFLFLIFFTFSSPSSYMQKAIDFSSLYFWEGEFSLTSTWEVIQWETIDFSLTRFRAGSEIIYLSGAVFESKKDQWKNYITLSSWDFIIHASTQEEYEVDGKGFSLNAPEGWTFFLHISEKGNISIFSQDTYAKFSFLDPITKENYSDMYIFPHMLVRFNPARNKFLRNADRIRIESVLDLEYLFLSFSSSKEEFIKELSDYSFSSWLLEAFISYKERDISETEKLYTKIIKRQKSFYFPWQSVIEKYKTLFLNKTKKIAYYEWLFQEKIEKIFTEDSYNQKLVEGAILNIEDLKNIDKEHYEKAKTLLFFYHKIAFSLYNTKAWKVQEMYSDIVKSLYTKEWKQENYLFLPLRNAFNLFDYKEWKKPLLQIEDFEKETLNDRSKDDIFFDYLSYFLEQILLDKSLTEREDFRSKITILENYIYLNNSVYGDGDEKKRVSWVYINLAVFKNILKDIESVFFETERNGEDLLVMKSQVKSLSKEEQESLDYAFKNIKSFFFNNKEIISSWDEKDKGLLKAYEEAFILYDEYFLALTDYENYTFRYDKATGDLLWKDILWWEKEEIILWREHFINYMAQFSWINLWGVKLEIKEDSYYHVENIIINGSNFSFSLYPFNDYEIRDIVINGQPKSVSYKLAIIKEDWKEEQKYKSLEEKGGYDFSLFFQLTFFSQKENEKDIYNDEEPSMEEDRYAQVFKANKLLWEKGEFSLVSDFLFIPYESLILEKKWTSYAIFLLWSELVINLESGNNLFKAIFDAEYHLSDTEHYFSDIKLKIYKDKEKRPNDFYLINNVLLLVGDIEIMNLEEEMKKVLQNIKTIDVLTQAINTTLWVNNMEIKYYTASKKTTIKFDFQGKNANIMLVSGMISTFFYDGKIIISKQTDIKEFSSYLEQIKK